jgi:hypothetical protein
MLSAAVSIAYCSKERARQSAVDRRDTDGALRVSETFGVSFLVVLVGPEREHLSVTLGKGGGLEGPPP